MTAPLFPAISGDDWRRGLAAAKLRRATKHERIKLLMKLTTEELFLENLDVAIEFHRTNHNDHNNIDLSVMVALQEIKDAFFYASRGHKIPKVIAAAPPARGASGEAKQLL